MKQLGIKYQILMITLIPVLSIDCFFTYTNINTNIGQATRLLQSKGEIIARQLAGASEFNLFTGNDRQIEYLLTQSVDTNDIVLAAVYNREGRLIAEAVSSRYLSTEAPNYLYYRQPILTQSIEHADVFSPDANETRVTNTLGWVHLYISRQQLQQTTQQIIFDSIAFFLLFLIMAVILTIIISRRITRPVFRLMEHLKFVETGQLGKTIEPIESNEIGAVQRGFNSMTHALLANRRHLNQRIQQATHQLNEAIADLETKNRELGFARDEAQNANRTKSEFLANMSHEIRTPINGIKGFISLLSQSSLDETQQRYVDIMLKSTSDLTNIVNEILDFSKLESGKLHIVDEPFDLYEVIEQTRDILFINVLTKNIDLNLIIFSDVPRWVTGDKLRLKQILLNLIGNAIKFTDHGAVIIKVRLEQESANEVRISISIQDSGIGISAEDQQTLFQAFSQVDSANNRRFSGTGLGLVISKNLASLMGGDISMQSIRGAGSTFTVDLPFGIAAPGTVTSVNETLSALILAAEPTCMMETRSLFDRAGVVTDANLIESSTQLDSVIDNIHRNLAQIELLVIDQRHLKIDLARLIDAEILSQVRVIVIGYDQTNLADIEPGIEFISVINTSQALAQLVLQADGNDTSETIEPGRLQGAGSKQVLLVDDNEVNLKLASELIQIWGHEVTEADHGSKAFEHYQQQSFDLIILDIQMPDIDGVALLKMIREHRPQDSTPIVALTANTPDDEAERLLELGFDYYLSKPIDEQRFRSLLDGSPTRRKSDGLIDGRDDSGPLVTFDYGRSLELSANNGSLLRQILEILQRDIPDHQGQLARAALEADRKKLGEIAHKLHGVTCYASLPRLRVKLLEFEQRLACDEILELSSAVETLSIELEAIRNEVEQHLPLAQTESALGS